jgi:hypothetical protein
MLKLTDPLLTRAESKAISVFRLNQVPFGSSGIAENPLRPGSWQESCGTLRTFVGLTRIGK